ncbi:amidase [Salipiger sp. IMCC34102]|uniref:amidase n=1 Tax=Salipiger sp. IMCC34102 TaxID=2510647 RepID=UPI00101C320F|nr:amidase family protein [Salipiger sp. IMCC34102]RYH02623.1 amidase [Salipiger sp. IMCC34102]
MIDTFRDHDAIGLAELVAGGQVSPTELLDTALARARAVNPAVNAVVNDATSVARARISAGLPDGPLRGVPFLLKDLGCEAVDYPCHIGSRLFRDTRFARNSAIFDRLSGAGLVPFARTTAPEMGIGTATEAAVYGGPTRNPWSLDHTPGGSSGGAAAAVAAGIVPAAHGSDGGGSVRVPASNCGLFGFKATRARLPDGPYAGEGWAGMAIEGFLTRSVRDTALLTDICAGADLGAPYAAPPMPSSFMQAIDTPVAPLRIALCDTTFTGEDIDPVCRAAVQDAARLLEDMGHHVVPARPAKADTQAMMSAWTDIVACGTAEAVLRKLGSLGRGLLPDDVEGVTRGALAHAATISGADYIACIDTIHAYGRQMADFFQDYDILLTPTLAEPPARIGRLDHATEDYVGYRMEQVFPYSPFAAAFNASGQPAASVPLYWSEAGLPIGIHLAARFGEDTRLMALCADLERARPWFHRTPRI